MAKQPVPPAKKSPPRATASTRPAAKPGARPTPPKPAVRPPSPNGGDKLQRARRDLNARRLALPPGANDPLWKIKCPIIGLTGLVDAGKTIWALSVNPDPETTLIYDFEVGSETYEERGHARVSVADAMEEEVGGEYKPWQLWEWFRKDVFERLDENKFRTVILDPVGELEDALEDWLRHNPGVFHRTRAQYDKMNALLLGDVKKAWKRFLTQLAPKVDSLIFITHMKAKYVHGENSGVMVPEGKSPLERLATLYLQLKRPVRDGSKVRVPDAEVLKSRLAVFRPDPLTGEQQVVPVLPHYMRNCVPGTVRWYMENPHGLSEDDDDVPEERLTDDERLALRQSAAVAEARTEELRAGNLKTQLELEERKAKLRAEAHVAEVDDDDADPELPAAGAAAETAEETAAADPEAGQDDESPAGDDAESGAAEADAEDGDSGGDDSDTPGETGVDADAEDAEEDETKPTASDLDLNESLKEEGFKRGITQATWDNSVKMRGGKNGRADTLSREQIRDFNKKLAHKLNLLDMYDALYGTAAGEETD